MPYEKSLWYHVPDYLRGRVIIGYKITNRVEGDRFFLNLTPFSFKRKWIRKNS